mgnify:CR=1 FL=1
MQQEQEDSVEIAQILSDIVSDLFSGLVTEIYKSIIQGVMDLSLKSLRSRDADDQSGEGGNQKYISTYACGNFDELLLIPDLIY